MDLRFVARESDFLILENSSGERFRVLIDDQLRDATKQNLLPQQSGVAPREVQSRLRAGEELEAIATDLGVSVAAIEPFAAPIIDELNFVIQAAMNTLVADGDAMVSLQELMQRDNPGANYKAHRKEDRWIITVSGSRTLVWRFDPRSKSLEPANSEATDLIKSHAPRDIVTATIQVIPEQEEEGESASVLDLVEELRARRKQPETVRPAPAKGRASLPSWDEIVLGTNQSSEADTD